MQNVLEHCEMIPVMMFGTQLKVSSHPWIYKDWLLWLRFFTWFGVCAKKKSNHKSQL